MKVWTHPHPSVTGFSSSGSDTLGGAAGAGLVMGAGGVAMLVATVVLGQCGVPRQRIGAFGLSLPVVGVGFVIGAARPGFGLLIAGVVIALASVPVVNAAISTVFHERVANMMQGRVFGLRAAVGRAMEPIGSITAGIVITLVAEPVMADDGIGAATIGQLIGGGEQRGSASVMALVGVAVGLPGLMLAAVTGPPPARHRARRCRDRDRTGDQSLRPARDGLIFRPGFRPAAPDPGIFVRDLAG